MFQTSQRTNCTFYKRENQKLILNIFSGNLRFVNAYEIYFFCIWLIFLDYDYHFEQKARSLLFFICFLSIIDKV